MVEYNRELLSLVHERFKSVLENVLKDLDINVKGELYFISSKDEYKLCEEDDKIEYINNLFKDEALIYITKKEEQDKLYYMLDNSVHGEFYELDNKIVIELNRQSFNSSNVKNLIEHICKKILYMYEESLKLDHVGYIKNGNLYIDNHKTDMYIEYYKSTEVYRKSYRDIIKYECQFHIENVINENKSMNLNLDDIDIISSTPYEGKYSNGMMILEAYDDNKKIDIDFKIKTKLNDHKRARKLLEMSNDKYELVSDGEYITGLRKIEKLPYYTRIKFNGKNKYSILHNGKKILDFEYGYPTNKNNIQDKYHISSKIENSNINENIYNDVINLVENILSNKKGGMIVISQNPEKEAKRLANQCILIDPVKVNGDIVKSISRIDGSLLIDEELKCYATGVILDGDASNSKGDSSRGSRYNSALKYISRNDIVGSIAIVISEDGMVDVIDSNTIEKLKKEDK